MTKMTISTLPTGKTAGPAPSGPPAARAGAPPGFIAALDTAAQTWTAPAEGHTDNARPRTDAAATQAKATTPGQVAKKVTRDDADDTSRDDATDAASAPNAAATQISATDDGQAPAADPSATPAPLTDAPVAPDTALLAMLGMLPTAAAQPSAAVQPPLAASLSATTPIVPSATPPMVGATPAELAANAQLPAAPTLPIVPLAGQPIDAAATAAAAAGTKPTGKATVAELLAGLEAKGTPSTTSTTDLEALAAKAAAAAGAAPAPGPGPAPEPDAAQSAADGTVVAPGTDPLAAAALADASAAAQAVAATPTDASAKPATPADTAAATLAAATVAQAPVTAATPTPAPQQLSPLAQAIQAAATQQAATTGGGAQGNGDGKSSKEKDSAAAIKATAPSDAAGATLAGAQAAAGMPSTAAAPAAPTVIAAPNPAAQTAAIEAMVNLARKDGASHARIKLAPEALGGIQVTLTFGTDGVTARLIAERPEAAAALAQAGQDLKDSLSSQGIDLASLETALAGNPGQGRDERQAGGAQNGFGTNAGSHRSGGSGPSDDSTLHIALDDQSVSQQPLAAGRTIDLRA